MFTSSALDTWRFNRFHSNQLFLCLCVLPCFAFHDFAASSLPLGFLRSAWQEHHAIQCVTNSVDYRIQCPDHTSIYYSAETCDYECFLSVCIHGAIALLHALAVSFATACINSLHVASCLLASSHDVRSFLWDTLATTTHCILNVCACSLLVFLLQIDLTKI